MDVDDLQAWLRKRFTECEGDIMQSRALVPGDLHWSMPPWLDRNYMLRELLARRQILDEHRQVNFTDVVLGIKDAQVCATCHGVLVPEDADDKDWDRASYSSSALPIIQVPYPCKTVRLLALPFMCWPGYREEWRP